MKKLILNALKREVIGRKVKSLRKQGLLPANIYGKKIKSQSCQVDQKEFMKLYQEAGETGIVELVLDNQKLPVLIHNIQKHPVTDNFLHVDFYQVNLKEKVTTSVPLIQIGISPAITNKIGVLLTIISEVEVESLPGDLPDKIEVDISKLTAVGDTLKISDLEVSDKVKILNAKDLEVLKIAPLVSKEAQDLAKEQEEAKAAAAAEAATQVEEQLKPEGTKEEKPTTTTVSSQTTTVSPKDETAKK